MISPIENNFGKMFPDFPVTSRLWVFGFKQALTPEESAAIESSAQEFVNSWHSHKVPVAGACRIIYSRFLLVVADESVDRVSGCSTDGLQAAVRVAAKNAGREIADYSVIFARYKNEIHAFTRAEFRKLCENGEVSRQTTVFDLSLQSLDKLGTSFEVLAGDCWHQRAFNLTD